VPDPATDPTTPEAATPVKAKDFVSPTVPTIPEAATPDRASDVFPRATVPTAPVADTPVKAKDLASPTDPTLPDADTPVRATTTTFSPRAANGACANADIPNMVYGLRRLRLGCCQAN